MAWYFELLIYMACSFVTWQLMFFFFFEDGKIWKWRLRNSIDAIHKWNREHPMNNCYDSELTVTYRNKTFNIGIYEEKINQVYKIYKIFINGEETAKYHCMSHLVMNSYYLEMLVRRDSSEVAEILHAGKKYVKKLEKETTEKKTYSWETTSYFK